MNKYFKHAEALSKMNPKMDFFEFENKMINKFEDEADGIDMQELYCTYFM